MYNTPETDKETESQKDPALRGKYVPVKFARSLERDVYNLTDQRDFCMQLLDRLEKRIESLRKNK